MNLIISISVLLAFHLCFVNTQSSCNTPSGGQGQCKSLYDCKPLYDLLNKDYRTPQELDLLQKSKCGFIGKIPAVCCLSENTVSATVGPVSDCNTAEGKPGQCVDIYSCSHIAALLEPPVSQQSINYVQKSKCNGNTKYSVCCGPKPNVNTALNNGYTGVKTCKNSVTAYPPDPNSECCGIDSRVGNKIVGGTATTVDQYPWLGLIEYHKDGNVRLACGGALISGKYVLTAGHCLIGDVLKLGQPRIVRLSEYDTTKDGPDCAAVEAEGVDCTEDVFRAPVERTIPHPQYDPTNILRRNDIGLIRLRNLVPYTDFIRPICLPATDLTLSPPSKFTMFAAGWGAVSTRQSSSTVKLHVELPFINMQQCQVAYSKPGLNTALWNKQMCAGGEKDKDTCKGDSGGPLMYENGRAFEVIGVVSFGPRICGTADTPGVYSKVFEYKQWILSNIRD